MIQRLQSLFLLLAAILIGITCFTPLWIWTGQGDEDVIVNSFSATHRIEKIHLWSAHGELFLSLIIALFISVYIIFQFRNRKRQMWLCLLNGLILLSALVFTYYAQQSAEIFNDGEEGQWQAAAFFPVLAIILHLLAFWFIRKDEALVKSADQIR